MSTSHSRVDPMPRSTQTTQKELRSVSVIFLYHFGFGFFFFNLMGSLLVSIFIFVILWNFCGCFYCFASDYCFLFVERERENNKVRWVGKWGGLGGFGGREM